MPEAKKITKLEVINAYCFSLRMRTRKTEIENTGREETDKEQDERLEAIYAFDTLELQYLAEQVN